MISLSIDDIRNAAELLKEHVHRTPLLSFSTGASCRGGKRLFLKCENLQKSGAFKGRGAFHFLSRMDPESLAKGVITYSSGNHGGAMSWAAKQFGIEATVFVPEDIPTSKRAAIENYGGRVIDAGRTSLDRKNAAEAESLKTGATIVPPFDHPHIISGQGTAGLEIVEELSSFDRVWVPVGGGGLLAGIALAIKSLKPEVEIVGVEPVGAASMKAAIEAGHPVPISLGESIADGLRPVQAGELTSAIVREHVDHLIEVDDESIRGAMWALIERAHLVVEPSGAAAFAGYLYSDKFDVQGTDVVVLSGGNIDRHRLKSLI